MEEVRYGGSSKNSFSWWYPAGQSGGSGLLAAYLKIMKWPEDLTTTFPFNAEHCKGGCPLDFALMHTLEFREKFKPWLITPSVYRENKTGWMIARGYSPSQYHSDSYKSGFSIVWYTPGSHPNPSNIKDHEAYIRVIVNALETGVADALNRSGGKIGKCNVILDCTNFGISMIPPMHVTKKVLKMLQDHFPDRLGVLVVLNMATAGQMFFKLLMPFIPEVVRKKIHILPNDEEVRFEMLKQVVEEQYIPNRWGGEDDFIFDSKKYYESEAIMSETEGKQYIKTMPYHA